MKQPFSLAVVWVVFAVLVFIRISYLQWDTPTVSSTLTWDALGYYLYLPGEFIYHDIGPLKWFKGIVETYQATGDLYQICPLPNGNFAMKYLMGLSILYAPFFFIGHWAAGWLGYPQDGFSVPYQLAVCLAALAYALLGLWVLRRVLLRFFSDQVTGIVVLLVALATNYPQYVSVDSGQTHCFLFTLYALVLWATLRWCDQPTATRALALGWLIGLSCIVRPTEGVMLFLALLWLLPSGKIAEQTVAQTLWKEHRPHLWAALAGGFLGILPQLVYWKRVTGHWVFDVGSSWRFLNPHWQVLFGAEKGWFVYTPVALLFVAGLFLMRGQPFRRSVTTFFILNTWIVIAWADWRYGATYSSRALLQGCAVLALPLGLVVQRCVQSRFRHIGAAIAVFLVGLNLFQIWQYNRTILHYNDNNFAYYRAIFLNPNPTPLDMSLLDTHEMLRNEADWTQGPMMVSDSIYHVHASHQPRIQVWSKSLPDWEGFKADEDHWLLVSTQVRSELGAFDTYLVTELQQGDRSKRTACRMQNGICERRQWNTIEYWFYVSAEFSQAQLTIGIETKGQQDIEVRNVNVKMYGPSQ